MNKKFFTQINKEFVDEFRETVSKAKSIVITSHISPDDDSISSLLSTYYYLVNYLKIPKTKIKLIYTGEKTSRWQYFENFQEINFVDDLAGYLKGVDLLIMLDGSGWMRFSRKEEMKGFEGYTVCIDHHPDPEDKFDLHMVLSPFSSTAEILYWLFFDKEKLDKKICEILLLGILGDTGNFKYILPDFASVFRVAERLVNEGEIKIEALQTRYQTISQPVFQILSHLMANARVVNIEGWPSCLVSFLPKKTFNVNKYSFKDVDEASGLFSVYLKTVKDVPWGMVVSPATIDTCAASLRSVPNSVSVRIIMQEMGIGGGHDRAAGGKLVTPDPEIALNTVLDWVKKNKPVIN